ncbi:hypothetical protein WKW80_05195 [Variovorax humicola]|uniref:DUF4124 domain-containing protein n=1 Tax=Variovorax humicola TaxID=1769758 RepID=A0ABU8VVG8_9BURK
MAKRTALILTSALFACSPAWALYKCTEGGKTSFQEMPCAAGGVVIKEQYAPEKLGSKPARPSVQEQSASLEKERLRKDAEYALRDKQNELDNFRERCARTVAVINGNRTRYNDNLTGAALAQADATAAQAQATSCSGQTQVLQGQVDSLQRKCDAMGCKAPL